MLWRNSHSRARTNKTISHETNLWDTYFEIIQWAFKIDDKKQKGPNYIHTYTLKVKTFIILFDKLIYLLPIEVAVLFLQPSLHCSYYCPPSSIPNLWPPKEMQSNMWRKAGRDHTELWSNIWKRLVSRWQKTLTQLLNNVILQRNKIMYNSFTNTQYYLYRRFNKTLQNPHPVNLLYHCLS